jgi:hypothetical protein
MADTIVTNTPQTGDGGGGVLMSVVLLVIVAAIAIGAVMMYRNGAFQTSPSKPDVTDINVTIPTLSVPTPTTTPAPAE